MTERKELPCAFLREKITVRLAWSFYTLDFICILNKDAIPDLFPLHDQVHTIPLVLIFWC